MTVRVGEQLDAAAGQIEDAVAGSRTRTMNLAAATPEVFGHPTLASWVDAGKRGVESAMHELAAEATTKATSLRETRVDFTTQDTASGAGFDGLGPV